VLEMAWSVGGADGAKCYSSNPLIFDIGDPVHIDIR